MNKTPINLLLIEDNRADVVLLEVTLARDPHIEYGITAVEHLSAGIQKIKETHFDIVLLDLGLPDSQGLDTFQQVHAVDANLPVVVLSGLVDEDLALQAVHLGAQDYVVKGTTGWDSLSRSIRYAMERKEAQQALLASEARYRSLFENSPVAIWEEDFSQVKNYLSTLQNNGVTDTDKYFAEHESALLECINLVQVIDVNQAALFMYKASSKPELLGALDKTLPPESLISFRSELKAIARGETNFAAETALRTGDNEFRNVTISWITAPGSEHTYEKVLISLVDITEHKQAEAKLRQSEEQYRYLFDNNPMPMWAYDLKTLRFLTVNDAAVDKYGYSRAEFLNMTITEIRPTEDVERLKQKITQPRPASRSVGEWRHKLKNGQIIDVQITSHTLMLKDREAALVIAQDITERKQAEQKYQQIFENSMEGIFQSTPEGRFISVNPAMANLYGYASPQDMIETIGEHIAEHMYLDAHDRQTFLDQFKDGDVVEKFEMKNRRKDGSILWTSTSARAIRNANGEILYYEGFLQDITERKRAEEKLLKSEARFATFFESSPVAMGISRLKDGKITHINQAFANLFGFSPEEAIGRTTSELNIWENVADRDRFITLLRTEKHARGMEAVARVRSGELRYVIVSGELIENDNEPSLLAQIVDITERKQAETAIRNSEQRFRALIENGLDYISLLDGEGNLLWESPSSSNMLGFNFNEYVGRSIFELMHPDDFEWTSQQFAQLAQQPGHRITGIFRLQRRDGSWSWVEAIASNFLADPSVKAIVINYRDITERKQAELELQQRNADQSLVNAMNAALIRGESLHTVIDILADGLMDTFACQGTNVYLWDAEAQALTLQHYLLKPEVQHQIEEALGSTIPLIHMSLKVNGWFQRSLHSQQGLLLNQSETIREWLTEFWEALAAALAKPYSVPNVILGIQSAVLLPLISGDQVIGLLDMASTRRLSETDLTRISHLSRQLTAAIQRQQADERVRRSEEFLNSVQNALSAHIAILDHQGNIVRVNSAWRKFAEQNGYEHPQYGVGINYLEICDAATGVNTDGAQEVAVAIRQVLAGTKRTARVEYPCHGPEEKRWFVLRVTRFVNGDQNWVVLAHENVTYRKQAEDAIRRSQSILAQAETMAHLGAWEIEVNNAEDIYSNPARWSDEVYRILGYEPGEVEATNELFVERVHPQDREKVSAAMHQAIAWNKPYAVEHRIVQPNGTERILEEHANLIRDEHGRLIQILGAVQDITEHKQIEETLKRTSEQFRVLFEASPEAIILIDPHNDWPIVDCNEAACLMNGYSRTELIGQSIDLLSPAPGGDEPGRLEYIESIRTAGILRYDDLHRRKDGTVFPITVSTSLIRFGDRELVLGIDRDITERKQAEQALRDSEALYRQAIEVADGVPYRETYYNNGLSIHYDFIGEGIRDITGYGPDEFNAALWDSLTQEAHLIEELEGYSIQEGMRRVRAGENPIWKCEYRLRARDGKIHWVLEAAVELRDENGMSHGSIGMYQDITARKQVEEALREAKNYAENLIQTANVIVLGLDMNGSLQVFNQAAQDITGYTLNELADKDYFEVLVPRNHYPEVWQEFQRLTSGGIARNFENPILTKSGEERIISWQNSVITDSADQITGTVSFGIDITERKRMEEALRLSAEENQAIINAVPDLLFRIDQAGVIVGYRARNENDLYVAPENFLGKTFSEVLPPAVSQTAITKIAQALATNQAQAFEYELSMHGVPSYYEDRVVPLPNREVLSIIRDITDRKQAEQALKASREQYRNLVDQLPVIVYTDKLADGVGVTQFISPQIEAVSGFSIQEWLSGGFEGWKQQIHSEDRERIIAQYLQSLSNGEPFEAEYRLQTKSGQWIWMHDQFKVVLDAQNHPVSSHGIMYDITERKQTEQAIQESEERYRTLVDQLPAIVYVDKLVDKTGLTQYVSPQIENIFGFTPEEWLAGGIDLWKAQLHPEDRERVLNEYQRCMETGQAFECEYRVYTKTGKVLWLHDQSRTVFDSQNQPVAAHGISYDITAEKLATEDRQRRVTELEALYENGLAIGKLLDPKSISDKVVEVLAQKLHWHHAAIRFYDAETNQLKLISLQHPGFSESQVTEQIERLNNLISDPNKGLTGWAVKQHLPLRQGDLPSDPRYIETYPGMRSGLYVPILAGDRVLGAISVESELINAFTEQDERLLLTLANQAAVAIENAQLYLIVQKELDERQQAELRLRESEARQNGIIEAAMDAIITVDETQHIVLFNGAAERIFGCPAVEALGQPLERFLPERLRAQHKAYIQQFSHTTITTRAMSPHTESVGLRVDGTEFPLEASISQISVAGTKLYTIILRDITERKIAEDELRQSEENYRLLFELSPEGIITHDGRQITFVNAAAAKLIGASSSQEIIGRSVLDFVHPDHHQLAIERIRQQSRGEHIEPMEEKFVRIDGSFVDVEVNAAPIRTQGKPAFLVTLRDITERKRAEEALRQSEENYRFLAEDLEQRVLERTAEVQDLYNNAPCGYHSLDEQGNIVLINETELKWLGYSREEVLHRPFAEFLTNESRNIFSKSFPAFTKDGEIRDLEFDLIRKDGSTLPVLINATAIYDHQTGKYLTSRSTLFDNTDRKYALEALRLANNEMKRALRTKDEFLANMSHELRTPLNAILGLSESLLEQTAGNLNEKQHRYLTTINESGTHLLELINDILDLAKVEAGQIKLDPGKVDINNLCQSSLRMIRQLAQKKSQKVEVNIQDNIGFIWADERRIKQMLVNLLSNAVKFTPEGGQLGLNALIDFKESKLLLTVWDNGIGIRDEDLPRLFKPFVQLDSSLSRETSGTGLGLALVAQMARLHGGSISVSSVPGQGSRFTIVLPWDPALTAETLEKMKITGRFPVIKSLPGKPKTILLVEDTDSVVMLVRDYLELSGYKVELARDGITGVSKAIASQPDLILMDVQMPGMDGFEAARRIRQEPTLRQTPIIALTALAMANDRERCLEAGMNDYISKPVNLRQLVKIIQNYVSNSGIGDAV